MAEGIRVSVVFALRREQPAVQLTVAHGTTAGQALALARLQWQGPAWPHNGRPGIFGRLVADDHVLRDGDRVEVLRPLVNDPKEIRRRRALQARAGRSARGR
jgi:putative ubiquitin-RnfH superfamily antitoxin RatB of RatAB toxin-antitoxin module